MGLRPDYQQTDIGIIPMDWVVKPVQEFSTIKTGPFGTLLKASEYSETDGVPLISVGEIREGYLRITDHTPRVSSAIVRRLPQYVLRNGDIVFGRKGGVDRSALVRKEHDGWFLGSDGISVRPTKECDNAYLALQFQSARIKSWLLENAIGTTMASLNQEILRRVVIPMPPTVGEQKAIADALTNADALITSLEQLIAKKSYLKRGAMQALLSGKKRLPGFSGVWKSRPIGEFASCTAGGTPSTKIPGYWGGIIPWMNSGELHLKRVTEVQGRITEKGLANSSASLLPSQCVLIGLAGQGRTRGTVAMSCISLCTNQSIAALLPNGSYDSDYLYHNLDARYDELRELSTGASGRGGLNLTIIKSVCVPFPSLPEQRAISAVLSDMEAEIAALEAKLDKARKVKQGMMQQLLTGKTRLI